MQLATRLIHEHKVSHESRAVTPPLILSTTFERGENGTDYPGGYLYSRYDTPNRHSLELKLASMEAGTEAICFSSGLAASAALFQTLKPGDHLILADDTYFAIRSQLDQLFSAYQISYTLTDLTHPSRVENAIQPNTRMIWAETPSNPLLKISDIEAIANIAKSKNCILVVDNTWATPYSTNPIILGADIVLHSTTKYLGGHCDLLGGVLICKEQNERTTFLRNIQKLGGAVPSAFDCWLLNRSLSTFSARMNLHCNNALELALYLESRAEIEKVFYPGLPSHPQHLIALKQMKNGFGGMMSILVKGGQSNALKLAGNLQLFTHATSLGGVESLIEHRKSVEGPGSATPDHLLRISVDIEAIQDLIDDFNQALKTLSA